MLSRNRFSQKNIDEDGNWWNLWCPVLKLCAAEIELHKNLAGLHSIFPKNLSADDLVLSQSVWILLYHLRASSHFPFMHMRGAGWAYRARYAITHSALVKPLIPAFRRWAILAFCGFLLSSSVWFRQVSPYKTPQCKFQQKQNSRHKLRRKGNWPVKTVTFPFTLMSRRGSSR